MNKNVISLLSLFLLCLLFIFQACTVANNRNVSTDNASKTKYDNNYASLSDSDIIDIWNHYENNYYKTPNGDYFIIEKSRSGNKKLKEVEYIKESEKCILPIDIYKKAEIFAKSLSINAKPHSAIILNEKHELYIENYEGQVNDFKIGNVKDYIVRKNTDFNPKFLSLKWLKENQGLKYNDLVYVLFENGDLYSYNAKIGSNSEVSYTERKIFSNISKMLYGYYLIALDNDGVLHAYATEDEIEGDYGQWFYPDHFNKLNGMTNVKDIDGKLVNYILFKNGDLCSLGVADGESRFGNNINAIYGRKIKIEADEGILTKIIPDKVEKIIGDFAICEDNSVWKFSCQSTNWYKKEKILIDALTEDKAMRSSKWKPRKTILDGENIERIDIDYRGMIYIYNANGTITTWDTEDMMPKKMTLSYLLER